MLGSFRKPHKDSNFDLGYQDVPGQCTVLFWGRDFSDIDIQCVEFEVLDHEWDLELAEAEKRVKNWDFEEEERYKRKD